MKTVVFNQPLDARVATRHLAEVGYTRVTVEARVEETVVMAADDYEEEDIKKRLVSCPTILQAVKVEGTYDCMKCGACCTTHTGMPWHTFPTVFDGQFTRCQELSGDVTVSCSCDVYTTRPQRCLNMKPGSLNCQMERIRAGMPREPT